MLKVCRNCSARPAHSLEVCPNCQAPIDEHGVNFFWDYEVQDVPTTVETLAIDRPKNGDKIEVWQKYAKSIVEASGTPGDVDQVDKLNKSELIELFG